MVLSVVIDMLQTNLRQLGWAYYVFADRCRTDGWRCVVEQKFLSWQLDDQNKADLTGAQNAWDYQFTLNLEDVQQQIDVIPESIFDRCRKKYGALAVYHMLTEPMPELEDYLNRLLDGFSEEEDAKIVEAIVIYPMTPASLRRVAEVRGIPLFVLEVSPMRWPLYLGGAYLSHYDQLSTDPGECKTLYQSYLNEWQEKARPLLIREQILAIFLQGEYLPYLRYLNIPGKNEVLLIGNSVNGKGDWPMNWDETMRLAKVLRKRFGDNARIRRDLRESYGASFGFSDEQHSQETPNIVSMLKSKRVVCAGSNMLFEAMLWNRPVYCDTKDHGLYFICNHTDEWKDDIAPVEFLNFYALVYVAPMAIATTDEYIRWRLTEPSLEALYMRHLNYYLQQWELTAEDVLGISGKEGVDIITQARGFTDSFYPRDDMMDTDAAWVTFDCEINYDIGPFEKRILAQKRDAEALAQAQAEVAAKQERIANLEDAQNRLQ